MNLDEVRDAVARWRASGTRYGEAVVVSTWHSAPRRPGARFLRAATGEIAGNVSAGCVEADLSLRLDAVLAGEAPSVATYGVADETAHAVGLACGGTIEVWLAERGPRDPVWPALVEHVAARRAGMLLTDLSEGGSSGRWLLGPDGGVLERDASISPLPPEAAIAAGRDLFATGGVAIIGDDTASRTLVEVFLPARRLVVVGATPIGVALESLARTAGVAVSVIEPRSGYAGLLADGADLDERWPDEALAALGPDHTTAIAVVAHDARIDEAALSTALESSAGYIGLLGGRKTREARFASLSEIGVEPGELERVHAPIGLNIGAETPAEIALSILAQIVAAWRGAG